MKLSSIIPLLCFIASSYFGVGQSRHEVFDGPYIAYQNDSIELLWVDAGNVEKRMFAKDSDFTFQHDSLPSIRIDELDITSSDEYDFQGVKNYAAISDIHGQYDLFVQILKSNGFVDENLDWTYGDGHLVIVGDVMDRGPKVIECLWLLYKLEKQALKNGGRVHLLLGNHELMVINNNLGYLNRKYVITGGLTGRLYSKFFDPSTFFGKWLSTKPISISINDCLFVHGGFSERVTKLGKPLSDLNGIFQKSLYFKNDLSISSDSLLSMLYFENGPLWYRGYALPSEFDKDRAKAILKSFQKKRIVVGHTSMPEIKGLYNNRIILVDSSIKFGKTGEILMVRDSILNTATHEGVVKQLVSEEDKPGRETFFNTLYNQEDPNFRVATSIKTVYKNDEETYEESILYYFKNGVPLSFNIGLRTSGNMRRRICSQPPLKINFKKKELKAFGFKSSDKFKVLMPCKRTNKFLEHLKVEHLIYELYSLIDTMGLRSVLVDITIEDENRKPIEVTSLVLEDKEHFTKRQDVRYVDVGVIRTSALDLEDYIRFGLFQYVISNPDWELTQRHNLFAIKKPDKQLLSLVHYDFDYCGLINADYAVPHVSLPIERVTERYFMDKNLKLADVLPVWREFLKTEDALIQHIESVDYLEKKTREGVKKFIQKSYQILSNEKKLKRTLGLKS